MLLNHHCLCSKGGHLQTVRVENHDITQTGLFGIGRQVHSGCAGHYADRKGASAAAAVGREIGAGLIAFEMTYV